MANCERKNELKIYLSDKEQYILEQKVKISGMKSLSKATAKMKLPAASCVVSTRDSLRSSLVCCAASCGELNPLFD